MAKGKYINLSKPWFPHLYNGYLFYRSTGLIKRKTAVTWHSVWGIVSAQERPVIAIILHLGKLDLMAEGTPPHLLFSPQPLLIGFTIP